MSEVRENFDEIEKLARLVQDGDQDAFERIYNLLIDPIYRYVFYRVNDGDVEDIVENVFLKVWENVRQYRSGKNKSFSSWVFRIAHNLVVDYYRSSKDRKFDELSLDVPDHKREHNPINVVEEDLDNQILKKALARIKETYREFIIYRFINDFSNKEIAHILNKNEGALRIIQHRALKSLKIELESMGVKSDNLL